MRSDFKYLLQLVLIAAVIGFIVNQLRSDGLGLTYTTPLQQMQVTSALKGPGIPENAPPVTLVTIHEVMQAVQSKSYLIIDARPALFWEMGHIPGAISLPRKRFDVFYPKTEPLLREAISSGRPLLVYCADLHCPDAGELAKQLHQRGFNGLLLFEAGWAAWEEAGQPIETK